MLNRRGGPNKRGGLEDFFVYYIKNNGEGGNFFRLLHENKGKFLKLNKGVYPFFRHLRVGNYLDISFVFLDFYFVFVWQTLTINLQSLFQELKLHSWDGGSWTKDIMRRLIQSLPNLEVLAIDTATTIIDGEAIQNWDVLLDIVKYVSDCKKLRCLRFDLMDQLSFIPFLVKFGVSNDQ